MLPADTLRLWDTHSTLYDINTPVQQSLSRLGIRMKNISVWFIYIFLVLVLLTGCRKSRVNTNEEEGVRINNQVYQTLNDEDIQKFIDENNIEPLGVTTIYDFNTVIIFSDLFTSGYYEVYKKDGVVSQGRKAYGVGDWSDIGPIVFSGGTASGDYPFSVLYILDDELVNMNYIIEITGENGSVKIDIKEKAYAIETNKIGDIVSYRVVDSNGEILIDEQKN